MILYKAALVQEIFTAFISRQIKCTTALTHPYRHLSYCTPSDLVYDFWYFLLTAIVSVLFVAVLFIRTVYCMNCIGEF